MANNYIKSILPGIKRDKSLRTAFPFIHTIASSILRINVLQNSNLLRLKLANLRNQSTEKSKYIYSLKNCSPVWK